MIYVTRWHKEPGYARKNDWPASEIWFPKPLTKKRLLVVSAPEFLTLFAKGIKEPGVENANSAAIYSFHTPDQSGTFTFGSFWRQFLTVARYQRLWYPRMGFRGCAAWVRIYQFSFLRIYMYKPYTLLEDKTTLTFYMSGCVDLREKMIRNTVLET